MTSQQGFSLPETLVALLLFTLSFTALLNYQLMLAKRSTTAAAKRSLATRMAAI
ncbi:prepilin-type N-terminal cleavage/methylation domain-containing protein [Erwinia tracheiphila]